MTTCLFLLIGCTPTKEKKSEPQEVKEQEIKKPFVQAAPGDGLEYTGSFEMEEAINTSDTDGSKVKVLQYIRQNGENKVDVFRINMISFPYAITDTVAYYSSLVSEYASVGTVAEITILGKKAVQVDENITIEGVPLRQRSTSLLHRNINYTFVLTSNSENFENLNSEFLKDIKLK